MSDDRYDREAAGTSTCKKQLSESTSNHAAYRENVNGSRRAAEIEQLGARLRVLEREGEMLKGAFLEGMEERRKMMREINGHFDNLQSFMVKRELNRGDLSGHGVQVFSLMKERRVGLLQILFQESNSSSIVNKALKAQKHY